MNATLPLTSLLSREFKLGIKRPLESFFPVIFFALLTLIFSFSYVNQKVVSAELAGGIFWACLLLSAILGAERIFYTDFHAGFVEQMRLSSASFNQLIAFKILSHWLLFGLPIIILSPLFALWLNYPMTYFFSLWCTLCLGTPCLSLLGAFGAALTVGLARGGLLLGILLLPLYLPLIVLALGVISAEIAGQAISGPLYWMAAWLCVGLAFGPYIVAQALVAGGE